MAKLAIIERCLQRVRDKTGGDPERLHDQDVQDIFVLNMERAVQAAVDVAVHVVTSRRWGLPSAMKESFSLLERNKILSSELAARLRGMVGFRNIAVHAYQELDLRVLQSILTNHLGDLDEFGAAISLIISAD